MPILHSEEERAKVGNIIAKAWQDPQFKSKLISDPQAVLTDVGVRAFEGRAVEVLEDSPKRVHFVLPALQEEISTSMVSNAPGGRVETYRKVIAKAWKDPKYKAKLLAEPRPALEDLGFEIQQGRAVVIKEETPGQAFLVLPTRPSELSDEQLDQVVGGLGQTSHGVGHHYSCNWSCYTSSACG